MNFKIFKVRIRAHVSNYKYRIERISRDIEFSWKKDSKEKEWTFFLNIMLE